MFDEKDGKIVNSIFKLQRKPNHRINKFFILSTKLSSKSFKTHLPKNILQINNEIEKLKKKSEKGSKRRVKRERAYQASTVIVGIQGAR